MDRGIVSKPFHLSNLPFISLPYFLSLSFLFFTCFFLSSPFVTSLFLCLYSPGFFLPPCIFFFFCIFIFTVYLLFFCFNFLCLNNFLFPLAVYIPLNRRTRVMCMYARVCVCINVRMCVYMRTCVWMCIRVHAYVYMRVRLKTLGNTFLLASSVLSRTRNQTSRETEQNY